MTILDRIVETKADEIALAKDRRALADLKRTCADLGPCRDFVGTFEGANDTDSLRIIAELKKASPSAGVVRADFDAVGIARAYVAGGAVAISVLTDRRYFKGCLADLEAVRAVSLPPVSLPLLRKDFIIDAYQLYESRLAGADAVLLIATLLSKTQLEEYLGLANELGMGALLEIHDEKDLRKGIDCAGAFVLGVNNRDLATFAVSLETSKRLAAMLPKEYRHPLVSESGLSTRGELLELCGRGFSGFLIGESLMREADVETALRKLVVAA